MTYSSPMSALFPVKDIYDSQQCTTQFGSRVNDAQAELWKQADDFETVTTGYTLTNVTVGNGTFLVRRLRVISQALVLARLTFGSTTALTGAVQMRDLTDDDKFIPITSSGRVLCYDTSGNDWHLGSLWVQSSGGSLLRLGDHEGNDLTGSVPFTWATGDQLLISYVSQENNETQVLR